MKRRVNPRRWLMSALHMKEGPAQGSAAVQNAFESAQPMRAVMGYRGSTDGFHCRQRPAPSHDQHPDCPSGAQSVRSDPFVSENPDTRARSLQIRPAPERPHPPLFKRQHIGIMIENIHSTPCLFILYSSALILNTHTSL